MSDQHKKSRTSRTQEIRIARGALATMLGATLMATAPAPAAADAPGRGIIAEFEIEYLKFIADHHFSALRITELAAGTDATREAEISPDEGTSPSPDFPTSEAKATLPQIKSLARRANRMQREEILEAQMFLRDWYGIEYQPQIRPDSQRRIELLENTPAGDEFNRVFLEVFSRHHFIATTRSVQCMAGYDLEHTDLQRYCRGIVQGQLNEIDAMRTLLCNEYGICDYQPLRGLKGRHSGDEGEPGALEQPVVPELRMEE